MSVGTILLILILILLLGGGLGVYNGPWYGGHPVYVGGGLGLILLIVLVLVIAGRL